MPPPNNLLNFAGIATQFGSLDDLLRYKVAKAQGATEKQALAVGDNGIGHHYLGSVNTTNSYGVALPMERLVQTLGTDPANWRKARAEITLGDQTTMAVPIIDVGPGTKQQARGVVTDVSAPLARGFGDFDVTKAQVKILPNAGPDYTSDPDAWYNEQTAIGKQLPTGGTIGAEPNPTPLQSPTDAILSLAGVTPGEDDERKKADIYAALKSI